MLLERVQQLDEKLEKSNTETNSSFGELRTGVAKEAQERANEQQNLKKLFESVSVGGLLLEMVGLGGGDPRWRSGSRPCPCE
jgi:hypothetical protein